MKAERSNVNKTGKGENETSNRLVNHIVKKTRGISEKRV